MRFRDYKIFRQGHFYHVYNRGVNKQPIFLDSQDFYNFIKRVNLTLGLTRGILGEKNRIKALPDGAFAILCYCLMPNHFHFLIRQNSEIGLEKLIQKVTTSYAIYFNKKYDRVGAVYQDAFKAKIVDSDSYLTYLSAYIHRNPENYLDYDFSSIKDYLQGRGGKLCDTSFILGMFNNDPRQYQKFLMEVYPKDCDKIKELVFEED